MDTGTSCMALLSGVLYFSYCISHCDDAWPEMPHMFLWMCWLQPINTALGICSACPIAMTVYS